MEMTETAATKWLAIEQDALLREGQKSLLLL